MRVIFDIPEEALQQLLGTIPIPRMSRVLHAIQTPPELDDLEAALRARLRSNEAARTIQAGSRIAIGVGSRGIDRLPLLVRTLVDELRSLGAEPFIVPAMGSHGGATPDGQAAVLQHLGISEQNVGAPIVSRMETIEVGRTEDDMPAYLDASASAADGICFLSRIKPHTAFRGEYESGAAKMIAIGLGKQTGAAMCHSLGYGNLSHAAQSAARIAIAKARILFGVVVLENAYDRIFKLEVIPAHKLIAEEPTLLIQAREAMPKIPFEKFDVLVIDEVGKNISGEGADPNITGRYSTRFAHGGPEVAVQVVLDVTADSVGNALGIGLADFITLRAASKLRLQNMYANAITAIVPRDAALPIILPSDRLAFAAGIGASAVRPHLARIVRIKNTLKLNDLWVSEALVDDTRANSALSIVTAPGALEFDSGGNLDDLAAVEDSPAASV
jgi:hypothetical protein